MQGPKQVEISEWRSGTKQLFHCREEVIKVQQINLKKQYFIAKVVLNKHYLIMTEA